MTMHLASPALTLTGKRRGKTKFRNAQEAKKSRELDQSWQELQNRWGISQEDKKRKRAMKAESLVYTLNAPVGRSTSNHILSRDTGHTGTISSKQIPQYTGTSMLGVATLHKSNAVPVFSQEEAQDISKMRR
jgi:hypothetical protein